MVKGIGSLAAVKKIRAQELKQKQIINRDLKIEKICRKVAKNSGISRPVNFTVNNNTITSFKDIKLPSEYGGEFAPWSPLSRVKNNVKFDIKA